MTRSAVAAVAVVVAGAALAAGCTASPTSPTSPGTPGTPGGPQGATGYQLVSFSDCKSALEGMRAAARANLGAWGYGYGSGRRDFGGAPDGAQRADGSSGDGTSGAAPPAAADSKSAESSGYSGTNTHEAGVDEPDLVKTDGKRIITVQDGALRVVDAASRTQVARLDLATGRRYPERYLASEMLLSGDKVLLIGAGGRPVYRDAPEPEGGTAPTLTLIDLAGTPRVVGRYTMNGAVVDARQVGATVRVVMRSAPNIPRPDVKSGNSDAYARAMLEAINRSNVEDWLPKYTVDNDGRVTSGRVDCSSVARPAEYSAANLLTVLTFDLARGDLGTGDPVTVAADADTVYSTGPALYVASDQRWRGEAVADRSDRAPKVQPRTEIYKFDTSKPGRSTFVGGGAVDGWLLNQYSMSEWDGHLRVATTKGTPGRDTDSSESTVYVLRHNGSQLTVAGQVGGLGKGERIYSVRFVGGTGYVVTFRQTDPLYTVDLRNPAAPKVTGELKITGYSAYLHPAGAGRLIGIGQEASEEGRVQGTQVSLFDVSDPAAPKRLSQHHAKNARSEAEFDPHAFLYWPQTGVLVVPLNGYRTDGGAATMGALVLRIGDGSITELGVIQHPTAAGPYERIIRRSLVIDGTLWTLSSQGLLASDLQTTAVKAWVPFT